VWRAGVLAVGIAVLPWAVASLGGPAGPGGTTAPPESAATIESLATLPALAADGPNLSVALKRTEARVLLATPAGRSNPHLQLNLAHAQWPASSIGRSEPLALHLAGRGPPLALAA
jgi:hypothetical protein